MVKEMTAYFGNLALKEVTPRRVTAYKAGCREKGLAPSSIRYRLVLLNHAFNLAVREWEWLRENPMARVGRVKVNNERDRWLTHEEEKKLLDACMFYAIGKDDTKLPSYWLREIVVFALNTGMRQDEILSLKWLHVDLFRKTATVVRSKNGEKRTVPLNRRLSELLKLKAKVRDIKGSYVFASKAGTKIHHRNLRRAFYKALDRVEIEDFKFHDLRHTFATRLVHAGIDLYKVARLLGHKDIRMTQRYAHHYPESLRDGVEVLDNLTGKITNLAQSGQINEKGATVVP